MATDTASEIAPGFTRSSRLGRRTRLFLLVVAAVIVGAIIGHNVNVYWGANVGITWGHVGGIEIWGHPGFFGPNAD